jgi:hypothetical protein
VAIRAWVLKDKAGAPLTLGADGQASMDVAIHMKARTLRIDGHRYHFLRASDLPAWMDAEAAARQRSTDETSRRGRLQQMAAMSAGEEVVETEPPRWAMDVGPESPGVPQHPGGSAAPDDPPVPLAQFYRMAEQDLQHFLLVSPSPLSS